MISESLTADSTCTEQWAEISLDRSSWKPVGDVTKNDNMDTPFFIEFEQTDSSSSDIGGAIWHPYDFSKKRGILISFKPIVKSDESYFGNVKYPQGFAIVFTSSSIDNLIGEKGSGLGYEGIMNGIAFEFDFVKQTTNGDAKKPHFSVNYNINGAISASTKDRTDKSYNIILPNFYDNSLDGYFKNIIFEIEIVGKKLTVRTNREGYKTLLTADFPEFQQLLEQDDVHIGVTASMNQNKKITIEDFKVSEVSVNEKGTLEIKTDEDIPKYKAGQEITLLYSIKSTCGEKLKIYPDEYSETGLKLYINNEEVSPESKSFDEESVQLKITITETIENIYTALVKFQDQSSIPTKFIVTSSDVNRLELCYTDENKKYYLSSEPEQTLDYFYVPLCFYDQYGNRKQAITSTGDIKVGYPQNLFPPDSLVEKDIDEVKNQLIVKIRFSTFGVYKIFSEDFIESKLRYIEIMPKYISPEKSQISILYGMNIIQTTTTEIILRIKPKDNYGRDIPNIILDNMKCTFDSSYVIHESTQIPVIEGHKDDYVTLKIDKPDDPGRYIFVPKVACDGIPEIELECGVNFETKINNCEFFYEVNAISNDFIQLFDEYSSEYKTFSKDNNEDYLYISLDEKENKRLTEIILLDSRNSPYFLKSSQTITSKLDDDDLRVISIGNKYAIVLPKTRDNYSPAEIHNLLVQKGSDKFNIKIKFYSLDQYISNTESKTSTGLKYKAFYKQNSFTIEASDILLLFEIYEMNSNNHFGSGDTLNIEDVSLEIVNSDNSNTIVEKNNHSLSVSTKDLSSAGKYQIILRYKEEEIIDMNIEIISQKEAFYLANEKGIIYDNSKSIEIDKEGHIKLLMADKYKNIIQNNAIFNAYSKIKISHMDIFNIRVDYAGIIHIINQGKTKKSITLTLINGNTYTIESSYNPGFQDIDPLNTYGFYTGSSILNKNDEINVNLYLRDNYGNNIISGNIEDESIIDVYIEGRNLKKIVPMTTTQKIISQAGILYKASLDKNGDFEIKIFIKNIPVECKACHFRRNYYENSADVTKSTLYILGNKQKIPVLNSYKKENYKIGLVDKTTGHFSFYLDERDKYDNEYKETKSLTFSFESVGKSVDTSSISICPTGNNEDERNYFKLCSGVNNAWKNLPEGLYRLMALSETNIFYIYLTNSFFDSQTNEPDIKYSMILSNKKEIYGKTDMPGSFILDLRTEYYKRLKIDNIDLDKLTLNPNNNLQIKAVAGPEKGLLTVFLIAPKPGEYHFTIYYDGHSVIGEDYTYICTCGFDKKLKYLKTNITSIGNYAFFQVTDSKNNECSQPYVWNDLTVKEYANNIFKTKESNYKFDTYYNIKSNTFIFYFDNHVNAPLTLTSDLIKFNDKDDSQLLDIKTNILDENHFSVKYETNKLTITPLNANYEKVDKHDLNTLDFDIVLLRIINNDFEILKNDYDIKSDLTITIDDTLLDSKGKYIYVIYYKGRELFCENCIIDKTENNIDIKNTKVFLKEGDNNYIQNDEKLIMPMIKTNIPFFKINLFSNKNNLVILDSNSGLNINLKTSDNVEINSNIKIASNGNIYVYLTLEGRNKYLKLDSMTNIKLTITYSGSSYIVNYYVLDYPIKKPSSIEHCSTGAIPNIINMQDIYIKRYDEELELEIYLSGCANEQNSIKDKLSIYSEIEKKSYDAELIPTDEIGGYILFIPKDKIPVNEASKFYILNNEAKSDIFTLSIIPGYEINSVTFSKDDDMVETQSDKLYTYFMVELKDKNNNVITNVGRNLFINDINILNLSDNLPYRFTYDQEKKAFRCQVPINGFGRITATSTISSEQQIHIDISEPKFLKNSLVNLESEDSNKYTFSLLLKDEYYKQISLAKDKYKLSFKYFTINPLTEEVFIKDIISTKDVNNYKLTLDESYPKYSIYGFIPYIGFLPQICPSCIKLNKYPYYIYSIEHESFIPHNLDKKLYGIKDLDFPTYLYLAHDNVNMDLTSVSSNEILSTDNTKVIIIYSNQKSDKAIDSIQVNFKFASETITFSVNYIDYSQITDIGNKEIPPYIENYGYKVFTKNNMDNIHIGFFMENRDNSGKLITTPPNLLIDDAYNGIIKRISVINTCFYGIYYIKITFYISANIEFYPKFNQEHKKDKYITIQLKAISSFPNDIVLNNKEIINKNIVKYNLVTSNSDSEQACDERLNIYIDDLNLKHFKKVLVQEEGNCYLYIKFSGKAVIKSNINNFISEINNSDRTIYNINPQFSSLSIKPNVLITNEDTLELEFKERTPAGIEYDENEINENKNLYIYKYISPYKFQLIKTFSGLFSSSYPFTSDQLKLEQGYTYILIGDIVNNNIPPLFAHYQSKKSENENVIKSINAEYFTEDKRSYKLLNFEETKTFSGDRLELNLPLLLKVQLLDSSGNPIKIEYDFDNPNNNLKAYIILAKNDDINIRIELNVFQYNDETFYIKPDKNSISSILHLPVNQNQEDNMGYLIQLSYKESNFYSLLYLKQTDLQVPSIKSIYTNNKIDLQYFEAKTYYENNIMHIPKQIPNIQQICLYITSGQSGPILNEHLDIDQLSLQVECNGNYQDFTYVNSYMGCFAFSTQCESENGNVRVNYKNVDSSSVISIKTFESNELNIKFDNLNTKKTREQSDQSVNLVFNNIDSNSLNPDFFKVFVNGEKYEKTSISLNANNIQLEKIDKVFTSIQKVKRVMVIYENSANNQTKLMDEEFNITVIQRNYDPTSPVSSYKIEVQETFDLKVNGQLYFYILLYDSDKACYYGEFEKLSNMRISIKIGQSNYDTVITEGIKIDGLSQCEYIYLVQFTEGSKLAGKFPVNIEDNQIKRETNIYIAPNEIDQDKSSFAGNNRVKAGQILYIKFSGTDSEGNSIDYYDLLKEFDIQLVDSKNNVVEKEETNYQYNIRVNSDNTAFNISLKIKKYDTFVIQALYNNQVMNLKSIFKINVEFGQCSMYEPNTSVMLIDGRDEYYIGETITVHFQCKDILGNVVEVKGDEIFTANIRQILDDQKEIYYDYKHNFENGNHYISFTPSKIGKYSIDISLNGKKYGDNLPVEIKPTNRNKISCLNKKQVDNIIECDNDYENTKAYRHFVRETLGELYSCYDNENQGQIYKCFSDSDCVTDTKNCDCLGDVEKKNGYCYPKNIDPIEEVKNNKQKITCLNKIKAKNPDAEVFLCNDGTCRFSEQECLTNFECPLGFRSCGNKCILVSESCSLEAICYVNEVLCWDLSCAKNYDLCPTRITCPKDKVLCPDGTCQLSGHCIQPLTRKCSEDQYQCPDFSCVSSREDCKKNPVCDAGLSLCENGLCQKSCQDVIEPDNKFRCPNGKFVDNSKLCPSEIFVPSGYIKCSNGGIATNYNECSYTQGGISITCPNTKPILCPDLACVSNSNQCNTGYMPSCPPHKPYKCWNNECRKSFEECPTPVTCPSDSPVLCQNGFCAKSSDECKEKSEETCKSKYRCFDGSCVSSMELCPTHSYCGKDQIKCWNGACVNNINECRSTDLDSCPSSFPYRCPDGSCRNNYKDCSSISVCPPNLPIKCFDNSCRASINECPLYQTCGENKVSCPDGTCALSYEECNTVVTCDSASPFLCYDNTCKMQLNDCPQPPKCSRTEVLCPNGACASSRQNCKIFDPCESSYPIRCETNICTEDSNKCNIRNKRCPEGYILCDNGECKSSGYLCEKFECPKNKPYMCDEGVCVHDKSLCDNKVNGCPYNKQVKCPDGTCVTDEKLCQEFKCDEGLKSCPDGSCIQENEECPLINGCYEDRNFKCADGTCINPDTTSCTPALCPFDKPYKCPNGNCVTKSSDCSNDLFENELSDCDNGLIMCLDGRCVESSDYCRPLHGCEKPYQLCPDGSCRVSEDLCPKKVQCPKSRPIRCNNICVKNQKECSNSLCPNGLVKCAFDGLCKNNQDECSSAPKTDNICSILNKQVCKNGRCIKTNFDCSLVSEACPDDDKPYLCPNGECTNDMSSCQALDFDKNEICEEGKVMCSSGRCVENKPEILRTQCTNNIGCPLDKPYRCSNGDCVTSQRKCQVTSVLNENTISSNIKCDSSKPYLCEDKTCVSDTNFCKVSFNCPSDMLKCENGYCINQNESCEKFLGFCPTSNPIHCLSGTCVDDVSKCATSFNIPICNEGEFYCVRMNKCMTNKLDCLLYMENMIEKNETKYNLRLLHQDMENIVNPLKDEEYIKLHKYKLISLKEEEDVDPDKDKDKDKDIIDGTLCYDGTIATGDEKCPIVPACKIGQYRCENGACASDMSLCPVDETYICLPGQQKCPDGFCHKNCSEVAFHGCEVNKYQCSNGQCLNDKYDCIGYSMCPDPAFPFRCITGECKSVPEDCEVIERLGSVKNLTYSFNKMNKIAFNFAFDSNGRGVGYLEIPGNGLKIEGNYSNLYLEEVSSSLLKDPELYNNTAEFLFNVSNSIIGSEGLLNFENSVMSPVFKFYSKDKDIKFKLAGIINIAHNEYESSAFYYYDYCLAKLKGFDFEKDTIKENEKEKGWECIERQTEDGQTEFQISDFGVYAVILNPLRNKINYYGDSAAKNFFFENVKIILIILGVIIVLIAIVSYIFIRVKRYRKKYHANREKILLLKQQREEYENMTTDIFGQTLGDNINGIVYKSNPAYTVTDEIQKSSGSLEDEIEKLQIECKNVNEQNERLQKDIAELTKKYEQLSENIEKMNK